MPPKKKRAPFKFPRNHPDSSPAEPWLGLETPTGLLQRTELEEFGVDAEDWKAATDADRSRVIDALQAAWVVRAASAALISERAPGVQRPALAIVEKARELLVAAKHPKTGLHGYSRRASLLGEAVALARTVKPLVARYGRALESRNAGARKSLLVEATAEINRTLTATYEQTAIMFPLKWLAAFDALDSKLPEVSITDVAAALKRTPEAGARMLASRAISIGMDTIKRGLVYVRKSR